MRLKPKDVAILLDRLEVLHADDVTDHARSYDMLELAEVRRVAQHVADLEDAPGPLRGFDHPDTVDGIRGHGLLEQHGFARGESGGERPD